MQSVSKSKNGTPLFECVCPGCGAVRNLDRRKIGTNCAKCAGAARATHGMSKHPVYRLWQSMKSRCLYPSVQGFKYYGARGISVCEEWQDFEVFSAWALANGYAQGLEIDRLDNDGNYEPGNCRFIPHLHNSQKRSNAKCDLSTAKNAKGLLSEGLPIQSVCDRLGLPYMVVWHIAKGNTWRNA